MGIGFTESIILLPFALLYLALPILTLVLVVMIYRKLARLEAKLDR